MESMNSTSYEQISTLAIIYNCWDGPIVSVFIWKSTFTVISERGTVDTAEKVRAFWLTVARILL